MIFDKISDYKFAGFFSQNQHKPVVSLKDMQQDLSSALPVERLKAILPDSTKISVSSGDAVISGHDLEGTSTMYASALNAWHQLVKAGTAPNPMAISRWIDDENPDNHLFKKIEELLGLPVLIDYAWLQAQYDGSEVASIVIVRHAPNHLLIADVAFTNPQFNDGRGLGQLLPLIEDMRDFALTNGIQTLSATASDAGISNLLTRYGIPPEDSDFGRKAILSGHSIPHEQHLQQG